MSVDIQENSSLFTTSKGNLFLNTPSIIHQMFHRQSFISSAIQLILQTPTRTHKLNQLKRIIEDSHILTSARHIKKLHNLSEFALSSN